MFSHNVGGLDRTLRTWGGLALLLVGLLLLGGVAGSSFGLAVAAIGVLGVGTGAGGYCPLYQPFGISTVRTSRTRAAE